MRKILFCFCTLLLIGCSSDDNYGSFESAIIDDPDSANNFEQVTFLISLKNDSHGYLAATHLDSVKVKVDTQVWGTFKTEILNTNSLDVNVVDRIPYTIDKTTYLVKAPFQRNTGDLETAGDFAQYLNSRINLTPGKYVAEFTEIYFTDLDGNTVFLEIQKYADFEVKENTTSSFLGEILVPFNL